MPSHRTDGPLDSRVKSFLQKSSKGLSRKAEEKKNSYCFFCVYKNIYIYVSLYIHYIYMHPLSSLRLDGVLKTASVVMFFLQINGIFWSLRTWGKIARLLAGLPQCQGRWSVLCVSSMQTRCCLNTCVLLVLKRSTVYSILIQCEYIYILGIYLYI